MTALSRILLKRSIFWPVGSRREVARHAPSSCRGWYWHQFGQFAEVLGGCCEVELFVCAFGSPEPHHAHADVSFEMGKQHFDFSALDE